MRAHPKEPALSRELSDVIQYTDNPVNHFSDVCRMIGMNLEEFMETVMTDAKVENKDIFDILSVARNTRVNLSHEAFLIRWNKLVDVMSFQRDLKRDEFRV